ncbi:MAG: tyrosine-type recombinase/integrase [Planctomycetales bacterium]|nr:tyrosine-type recombinase/integrase [Planctomycetales bacterium]
MPKSTHRKPAGKVSKPRRDFPLFPHQTGRWAKKVRGKLHYFGSTATDPKGKAALETWLDQRDDLLAGRTPRVAADGLTLRDLCNRFLTVKEQLRDSGEIKNTTFLDYHATCDRLIEHFGKNRLVVDLAADDFESYRARIAAKWNPTGLGGEITRVRVLFKYGYDAGLIDRPVRFGPMFKRPAKRVLRKERAKKGPRLFEPDQIHTLIEKASDQLKAMILIAANCGFGNADVGHLTLSALDLRGGWINFPRPKTGIDRRCKLWPETIEAIEAVIATRPTPKDEAAADLLFITKYGQAWAKDTHDSPVSKEFRKLLDATELYRPGLGFYALRHTFETIGGDSRDQVAVDHVMGHSRDDMASLYRERIEDDRLQAVADHVRAWLFQPDDKCGPETAEDTRDKLRIVG